MRRYKTVNQRYSDALTRVSWQDFERLLASYYTGQGYRVEHVGTAGSGARFDGGIDLKLYRGTHYIVVQCKHWNVQQVTHNAVHELLGVMLTEQATGAIVITSGEFTKAAQAAAAKEPRIQLIDGAALRPMLGVLVDALVPGQSDDATFGDLDAFRHVSTSPAGCRPRRRRYSRARNPLPGLAFAIIAALIASYVIRHAIANFAQRTSAPPSASTPLAPPARLPVVAPLVPAVGQTRQATSQQVPVTEAELREWKRKNAESMKILEKTTPEMPLSY